MHIFPFILVIPYGYLKGLGLLIIVRKKITPDNSMFSGRAILLDIPVTVKRRWGFLERAWRARESSAAGKALEYKNIVYNDRMTE